MKAINLIMRQIVPDDIDLEGMAFDKKGMGKLTTELASKHPDKYKDIIKQISDLGRNASYIQGETITLNDMKPTFDKSMYFREMKKEIQMMQASTPKAKQKQKKLELYAKYSDLLTDATLKSVTGNTQHNMGNSVVSGARGNPGQLKAMITTPAVYTDYKDDPIDMFIENSYGEGLRPGEYLASTFGTRKGVIGTKEATADAGDLAKQMVQSATRLVISEDDCGTTNGILKSIDDPEELRGRMVQRDYGGIGAGSLLDKKLYSVLKKSKAKEVMVRSPLTCTSKQGVCQNCAGLGTDGKFPRIGESAGITAAQALGEPLTQGALNTKHGGGALGSKRVAVSGFKVLNQIMQSPSSYPNKATVSEEEGVIESIEEAPQGGNFITINGKQHYVLPNFELDVKKGDHVEPGDVLSDGIVDVKDIIKQRGLGAGRKHYAEYLKEVFGNSGIYASSRNLEFLARGALDHVRIAGNEPTGGYLPDDGASYNTLVNTYVPSKDSKVATPNGSVGKYLQAPALHYSIGTKLTPKMATRLNDAKFKDVLISDNKPDFDPDMVRLRTATQHEPDWMAGLHTSYQANRLMNAANSGGDTNIAENIHFAPRLAVGADFGDKADKSGMF
jgi:DNA-directed RNA polymerase subunit beta'